MTIRRADSPAPRAHPEATAAQRTAPWILFMPRIPSNPAYVRVKLWRRLQMIGSITLKNSVYVLPNRPECVESFQWVAREVLASGGSASLCEGQFLDGTTDDEIERLFIEARETDYAEVAEEARVVGKGLRAKKSTQDRLAALETRVARLRQRLDEIASIDFCRASGREMAEDLVMNLERKVEAFRSPPVIHPQEPSKMSKPRGSTWVTRTGVHVDRIASAWLIRRFIDAEARFKFVAAKGYVPEPGELRFDMFDAEFTHEGDACTFEVLLARMGIDDKALRAIAEVVHDIDLRDAKFEREETAGVRSAITGLCAANRGDEDRIAAGSSMFDALYAFFSLPKHAPKGEPAT